MQQSVTGKGGKETPATVDLETHRQAKTRVTKNNRRALSTSIRQLG
ncbi:hypothetical protein D083_1131 [Dickeya solani RNS 08.23.3.1.A]|nr:hypothetical protein D083_1131 [Dickeya solani RNS 08.23.3.1.A]